MATILYKSDDPANFQWLANAVGPKDDIDRYLLADANDGLQITVVDLDHQLFDEWEQELDKLLRGPVTPGTILHTYKDLSPIDRFRLNVNGVVVVKSVEDAYNEIRRRKFPPADTRGVWRIVA